LVAVGSVVVAAGIGVAIAVSAGVATSLVEGAGVCDWAGGVACSARAEGSDWAQAVAATENSATLIQELKVRLRRLIVLTVCSHMTDVFPDDAARAIPHGA